MFEDKTYQSLLADALALAPANVDTRQGSIYRDALTGPLLALAAFYVDLDNLRTLMQINTAPGEYLDDKGEEYAVERQAATCATYVANITGTPPNEGEQFIIDDLYFDIFYDDDGNPYFECEEVGTVGNYVQEGTEAIPVATLSGLEAASVGAMIEAAADAQNDTDYRARIQERISGPAENGNKQHFKTWCESVQGVGHAKIISLWNGPNTVKGIIYGEDGLPATSAVVQRVQEYVDPDEDGDGEGDGLGNGAAEIGCHFTAVAPDTLPLDVTATVYLASGYDLSTVTAALRVAIAEYLKEAVIENNDEISPPIIRYNAIGSIFMDADGVLDYANLLLNGDTANIQPGADEVCVLDNLMLTAAS